MGKHDAAAAGAIPAPHEYIVDYEHAADPAALDALAEAVGAVVVETTAHWDYRLWQVPDPVETIAADGTFTGLTETLEMVSPNLTVTAQGVVEDPDQWRQWGLENTGQIGGAEDADIDAPDAWSRSRGDGVTVAVIDTGVDLDHPDLVANLWTNPGEIAGNGLDDDGNGFVDDVHGYDFANHDGTPDDDHGHGTHVAGTIAAVEGNGIGGAGAAPDAQIMALKFLDSSGSGSIFDALQALDYAVMMGAQISNNSWGGASHSSSFLRALEDANDAGHSFVVSAGNSARDTDRSPYYPANFDTPNVIAVAASTDQDRLASFSNWGHSTVDLVAPGQSVYSTYRGGGYATMSGTSMAAPHASAAAALVLSVEPDLSPEELRARLIETSDPVAALAAKSVSGGRLNAAAALGEPAVGIAGRVRDDSGRGLEGWRVGLDLDSDGRIGTAEPVTLTDADGRWQFDDLAPASWRVVAEIAPGYGPQEGSPAGYRAVAPGTEGTTAAAWSDLGSTGTAHDLGDEGAVTLALPVPFSFFGHSFSEVTVTANGLISFADPGTTYAVTGLEDAPPWSIAAFWADLSTAHGGTVYTQIDAATGALQVHFADIRGTDGQGRYDVLVTLTPDGDIHLHYGAMTGLLPEALQIGLRGGAETDVLTLDPAEALAAGAVTLTSKPATTLEIDVVAGPGVASVPDLVVETQATAFAEVGFIHAVDGMAQTVHLPRSFVEPVVFVLNAGSPGAAATARVTSVTADSFTILRQSPDGVALPPAALAYLVVEAGRWTLSDDTVIAAGRHDTGRLASEGFDAVGFGTAFDAAPLVFGQVQSAQDPAYVHVRQAPPSATRAALALETVEADRSHARASETVGWLAIEAGTSHEGGVTLEAATLTAGDVGADHSLDGAFAEAPWTLTALRSVAGPNPARAATLGATSDTVTVGIVEDQSLDAETDHVPEAIALLAVEGPGTLLGRRDGGQALSGTVWHDADGDGRRDPGEAGLGGLTVWLDGDGDGFRSAAEAQRITAADGSYRFDGLAPGQYHVAVDPPDGWSVSAPGDTPGALPSPDAIAYGWSDLSTSGRMLTGLGDDGWAVLELPFLFPFFGVEYGRVTVSANGYLSFGGAGDLPEPHPLAGPGTAGPTIAVLWDDLTTAHGGAVHIDDQNADRVTISWDGLTAYGGGEAVWAQAVLYADGTVDLRHRTVGGVTEATAGIGDGTGAAVHVPSVDGALQDRLAFRFLPSDPGAPPQEAVLGADGPVTGLDIGVAPGPATAQRGAADDAPPRSAHYDAVLDWLSYDPTDGAADWL